MWVFGFYRFFVSVAVGIAAYIFTDFGIWFAIGIAVLFRALWFGVDRARERHRVERDFQNHIQDFKNGLGPYGIRLANKAERDYQTRKSLSEVFTRNPRELAATVEQLEVMDTLFQAGMRPEGDQYLLHDLKLKYGRTRLQSIKSSHTPKDRHNSEK